MRISDWSSDVCSSDLNARPIGDTHFIPVVSHSIAPCYRTVLQRAQPSQVAEIAGTKAPPDGLDPMAASNTKPRPRAARPVKTRAEPPTARASSPPPYRPLQLAQLVDPVTAGHGWLHEMQYDGYRLQIGREWVRERREQEG